MGDVPWDKGQRTHTSSLSFFIFFMLLMKKAVAALVWLLISATLSFSKTHEGRAFWVVRNAFASEADVVTMMEKISKCNCNMVFVQVCGRGDAYYSSRILPKAEALIQREDDFDPLKSLVEEGHRYGLQVHAWVNLFFVWSAIDLPQSPKHVIHLHPNWVVYTDEGKSLLDYQRPQPFGVEGIFLSPGNPDVKKWITDVIKEIVDQYDVDGIHLDYVRYPSEKTDFNPDVRSRFREIHHVDPILLFKGKDVPNFEREVQKKDNQIFLWNQWRSQQVTETVRMIRNHMREEAPNVKLSAAVKPDYDVAVERYGQDWKKWIDDNLLDFVVIMSYSPVTAEVVVQVEEARRLIRDGCLFAGLGVYNQSTSTTIEQIKRVHDLGIRGLSLFSYNSIADDDSFFHALKENCFQDKVDVLFTTPSQDR